MKKTRTKRSLRLYDIRYGKPLRQLVIYDRREAVRFIRQCLETDISVTVKVIKP